MINGNVCHLVGLNLVKDGVKGRVVSVRTDGYSTSVEVVTEAGAFAMWRLHQCVEAEPGALVRAIEEASARIDRILGKTKPAEPPPVEEPPKPGLVWGMPYDGAGWHLGAAGVGHMRTPYSAWMSGAVSYDDFGASVERREGSDDLRGNCKTIAAWAREDGYIVPLHPVYGEV